jgi:hypothetical protein
MKGILTEEERETEKRQLKERERARTVGKFPALPKPLPPLYWPDQLPKLHNLACLLKTLNDIIRAIIDGMSKRYGPSNPIFYWLNREVLNVSTSAIDGLTNIGAFMYFVIQNGTHYAEAVKKVGQCGWMDGVKQRLLVPSR